MSDIALSVSQVQQARDMFFVQGRAPEGVLPPHITRSWMRCQTAGPDPDLWVPMATTVVRERRDGARTLLACAQPELDGLTEHLTETGCVAVICDAQGVILDEVGSTDFVPKAERLALRPGADWSEGARGTNAIGTALVERAALAVRGGEHYLDGNAILACAAAPIFDGRGSVAGVLDMSGEPARLDLHALGLVRMAARQIEHRLLVGSAPGQLLRFHLKPALLGTPREGVLAVVDGRVVAANSVGLSLLGETWNSLLDRPVEEVLGRPWSRMDPRGVLITLPGGRSMVATIDTGAAVHRSMRPTPAPAAAPASPVTDPLDALLGPAVRVADAGVPVLVTGETGVGKEVFAQRLHRSGRRRSGPFVAVNCAALPESLIEAELFGYEDGAFTGARRRGIPGRIREAQGGVLFLDEIGDMPVAMQTRLLRVLETRSVTPLGGGRAIAVDFDLVCATHCDLPALAARGDFRSDLLYRIAGYCVALPALRDRPDRRAFIEQLFADVGGRAHGLRLAPEALDLLDRQPWPGNVRELLNCLRTAAALATPGSTVTEVTLLPVATGAALEVRATPPCAEDGGASVAVPLGDLTARAIARTLESCGGRVAETARRLGIHRSTVYRHLAQRRNG
ncbi:sigma-54-dependent Fis family transcriptional regulator [Rhizobacter sp. LjRoot28]|uniref:sigma-54-dependent Fis family transcriptional regulator n=1 Tax=Rhizobacter sp. LjRoot28 TaxID=3342309 RepID=UPI003ECD957B